MTLAPNKIGDKQQRYEVHCVGYPKRGADNVVGWTDDKNGACDMGFAMLKAPGAAIVYTRDREDDRIFNIHIRG